MGSPKTPGADATGLAVGYPARYFVSDPVMDLSALPVLHRAVIPDAYLDEMGHMNVMWYTHLFSEGAWGLFQLVGMTREHFLAHRTGTFALTQHFRYLKEVRLGHHVTLRSRILGRSAKRWHTIHFMTIDESNVLAATSETVSTYVDLTARRSAAMPPAVTDAIDRLLDEHTKLGWDAPVCGAMKP